MAGNSAMYVNRRHSERSGSSGGSFGSGSLGRMGRRMSGGASFGDENLPKADWEDRSAHDAVTAAPVGCGNRYVVLERSIYRSQWNIILAILLIYTATVMPYTLCFLDFRLTGAVKITVGLFWTRIVIDVLFWVDLLVNFFFSYSDASGKEVRDLRKIIKNYLQGYFILNLIACIPDQVFESMSSASEGGLSSLTRLTRVQRLSRLGRLLRLVRLLKVFAFMKEQSWFQWLQSLRGVRMLRLCVVLLWINHLVACGWYLCAAVHNDPKLTWVGTRKLPDGDTLLDKGDFDQWLQSMYFVLTVFSTVGFGDIAAYTAGEIIYVGFTMLVGAVVHGTVMSEVINVVTEMDDKAVEHTKQKALVKAFVQHTELNDGMSKALTRWLDPSAKSRTLSHQYDRQAMKKILASGAMPYVLMEQMQHIVFQGDLMRNQFVQTCVLRSPSGRLPPRFPVILSLAMIRHEYTKGEIIYQLHDHPCTTFLVLKGVFASVALPTPTGGKDTLISSMAKEEKTARETGDDSMTRKMSTASMVEPSSPKSRMSRGKSFLAAVKSAAALAQEQTGSEKKVQDAFPYQLFPFGTYFGEFEIIIPKKTGQKGYMARNCSIRCETDVASVLVISRQDLVQMMLDFPHFGEAWYVSARNNERKRLLARAKHFHGMSYWHLAASRIQRRWKLVSPYTSQVQVCSFENNSEGPQQGTLSTPSDAYTMISTMSNGTNDANHSSPRSPASPQYPPVMDPSSGFHGVHQPVGEPSEGSRTERRRSKEKTSHELFAPDPPFDVEHALPPNQRKRHTALRVSVRKPVTQGYTSQGSAEADAPEVLPPRSPLPDRCDSKSMKEEVKNLRLEIKDMKASLGGLRSMRTGFEDMRAVRSDCEDLRGLLYRFIENAEEDKAAKLRGRATPREGSLRAASKGDAATGKPDAAEASCYEDMLNQINMPEAPAN